MPRPLLLCVSALLSVVLYTGTFAAQVSPPRAVLDKYCVTCHNEKLRTAGLSLENAGVSQPADNPAIWEKVLHKLRTREMPPPKMPQPDDAAYDSLSNYLEDALDRAAEARPNPGRPGVHRLN